MRDYVAWCAICGGYARMLLGWVATAHRQHGAPLLLLIPDCLGCVPCKPVVRNVNTVTLVAAHKRQPNFGGPTQALVASRLSIALGNTLHMAYGAFHVYLDCRSSSRKAAEAKFKEGQAAFEVSMVR